MPAIYILVGPPASGKSTWRESYLSKVSDTTTVLSTDDMIEEYATQNGMNYNQAFKEVSFSDLEKNMFFKFREALSRSENVIVDRTNMRAKSRNRFLASVPKNYKKIAVVFEIDTPHLLSRLYDRAEKTGKFIPEKNVMDMIDTYQEPTMDEFDSIIIEKQEI